MRPDFRQSQWDELVAEDCRQLVRLAIREDLERQYDWTTVALAPNDHVGAADLVARQAGVVAGMPALALALAEWDVQLALDAAVEDGQRVAAGTRLATLRGNVRDMLTSERTLLNLLGRLMGIATLAARYVDQVAGSRVRIYDTRKTTPGWRRLEKYAVRCGGAFNHRTGLYDAVLIKDNHLAQFKHHASFGGGAGAAAVAAAAVRQVREFLASPELAPHLAAGMLVEIEVDALNQLSGVLPELPDIVLLDNMDERTLRAAVELRDRLAPDVELEASGGVTLESLPRIAATGVDRISVGALTHSAVSLDVALDWHDA